MSRTVDERVVSMQFDNKQFEQNVSTSMSTLEKLKQSLNLTTASKGLENVGEAAKGIKLSGLSSAAETVGLKFNAMYSMADQALRNITTSVQSTAKRIVSAFTIDPIKTGFQEYETQINAVQTILANTESKGSTLQDVNNALAELNTYADKTIYNFTEMTRNIGTFTAAGVDLNTSVSAIKGIANLAAVSGSTSQQASTAMYQLSQALASGTVKLMDWNSVVNAGMGGQVFQDALKETARVHGIAIDDMIKKEGSFRETLQNGWLTSDILTETLEHFTMAAEEGSEEWQTYKESLMDTGYTEEQAVAILKLANTATDAATKVKTFTQLMDTLKESAQSGWTKSWEIMIGDFEEAKNFLTDVSDRLSEMIGASADARNDMLLEGLSSGWKQLLNTGIADEEGYKETLKSVAKEYGTSIDDMIASEKKLDESLTDGEAFQKALKKGFTEGTLSSDMLTESVNKMADKMSNMSTKELEASGYTAEHVKQIKELSEGLKNGTISMDEFVKKITRTSGRENIIQALWNTFDGLMNIITPVKEAFREIFPRTTGEQLYTFTERLRDITAKFKEITEKNAPKLKSTFKGLFAVIDIGVTIIKKIVSGIVNLISNFTGLSGGILGITGSIGDWISGLRDSVKESNIFGRAIDKVTGFIQKAIDKVKEFYSSIKEKFASPGFEGFLGILNGIWEGLKNIISKVLGVAKSIGKAIASVFRSGNAKNVLDVVNGGIIASILLSVKKYIGEIKEAFGDVKGLTGSIKDVLDTVQDSLTEWQKNIKSKIIKNIAIAIGILAAALFVISMIDSEKLAVSLAAITGLFVDLMASLAIFDKIDGKYKHFGKATTMMIGMSVAVLILASAMNKIGSLDWDGVAKGLVGVFSLTEIIVRAANSMSQIEGKAMKGALNIVIFSTAIKILASACADLAELSWEELAKGLAGVGVLITEISLFLNNTEFQGKTFSTAVGILVLSTALKVLASVCEDFSEMNWEDMAKGLSGVGALLLELSAFTALTKNATGVIFTGVGLIAIAAALKILSNVMTDISKLSWENVAKGLFSLGGSLALIAAGIALLPNGMKLIAQSVGLIGIVTAITILGKALTSIGKISWEEIAKGLVSLGASLGLLAAGLNLMKGTLGASGALVVAVVAIGMLTPVLKSFGSMSWGSIVKGLISLAGALTIIGVASKLLSPVVPAILKFSFAILLFGISCAAVGIGILSVSIAISSLGATLVVAVSSIVEAIKVFVEGLGGIIKSFCSAIIESASSIGEAIVAVIVAVCNTLLDSAPVIVDTALKLLIEVLTSLKTYIPQLVDLLVDILVSLMDKLADRIPELVNSAVNLIGKFFAALNDALGKEGLSNLISSLESVAAIFISLGITAKVVSTIPISGALSGIASLAIFIAGVAGILTILGGLAQIPGFEWIIGEGSRVLGAIGTAVGEFVGNIIGGLGAGITSGFPKIGQNLSDFMENISGFVEGIKSLDGNMLSKMKILTGVILELTAAEFVDSIASWLSGSWLTGDSSFKKLGNNLCDFGEALVDFSKIVSEDIDISAMNTATAAGTAIAALANSVPDQDFISFVSGKTDLEAFAIGIGHFGEAIVNFSDSLEGKTFNSTELSQATSAGQALANMANTVPDQDFISFIAGRSDLEAFATGISWFGKAIVGFSDSLEGKTFNSTELFQATQAGQALANMANTVPDQDFISFIAGRSDLEAFASGIAWFGKAIVGFSDSLEGKTFNSTELFQATQAGQALANMANTVPDQDFISFIAGRSDLEAFASGIAWFGKAIVGFSDSLEGKTFNSNSLSSATQAGQALSNMASTVPSGDFISFISGRSDLQNFATGISWFGSAIVAFSDSLEGKEFNIEQMNTATQAGQALANMSATIPNSNFVSFISGRSDLQNFATGISWFGTAIVGFSDSLEGKEFNIEQMNTATQAGQALANMSATIPSGDFVSFISGRTDLQNFAIGIGYFGSAIVAFSDSLADAVFNTEQMNTATQAGQALANMSATIPSGDFISFISGRSDLQNFATGIAWFGTAIVGFSDSLEGKTFNYESINSAANAGVALATMAKNIPEEDWWSKITGMTNFQTFYNNLVGFGEAIVGFAGKLSGIDITSLTTAVNRMDILIDVIDKLEGVDTTSAKKFREAINELGKTSVKKFVDAFTGSTSVADVKSAAATMLSNFIEGTESKGADVDSALETIATNGKDAIKNESMKNKFKDAGKYLGDGLVEGIKAKKKAVYDAAYDLGQKAVQGELAGQASNSPSKLTIQSGKWFGEGLVIGIDKMGKAVYSSGHNLGETAVNALSSTISRISDAVSTDIDSQPTIRPVLDLSGIRSGAGAIEGMLGVGSSIRIMSRVGAISSSMNRINQNGVNDDVVTAINKLRKDLGNVGSNTYTINGITYDDGSNISEAVKAIVRAAKVERRI